MCIRDSNEVWNEDAIFVDNDPTQVRIDTSQPYKLDGNVFSSGRLTMPGGIPMGTDIRASKRDSKTSDFSFGLKWVLSENTDFSTDLQYIKATTKGLDSTVALGVQAPYIDVAPVSYTHLDVYKRQCSSCSNPSAASTPGRSWCAAVRRETVVRLQQSLLPQMQAQSRCM